MESLDEIRRAHPFQVHLSKVVVEVAESNEFAEADVCRSPLQVSPPRSRGPGF